MWLHTFQKEHKHITKRIRSLKQRKKHKQNRWPLRSLNCAFVTVSNVVIRVIIYLFIRFVGTSAILRQPNWIIHIIHPVQKCILNAPVYRWFIEILLILKQS